MKILLLILGLVLLTACTSVSPIASTATPGLSTVTALPSLTPPPPATATTVPSTTRNPAPTESLTPSPTVDTLPTEAIAALVATVQPHVLERYPSSNGQWGAEVITYDCTKVVSADWVEANAYDLLNIIRLSDGQVFTAADQLQYCGGVGAYGLGGLKWSPDSRFFYFTDAREGVPDGGNWGWHRTVWRFDTGSQKAERLGNGPFSPDGKEMAVIEYRPEGGCHPDGLTVWDISGQKLFHLPIDTPEDVCWYGDVAWSPSSKELVYLETFCKSKLCRSMLYRIDAKTGERTALLEDQEPGFLDIEWESQNQMALMSTDYKEWSYSLSSGVLAATQTN